MLEMPELIYSALNRRITRGSDWVEVKIYRAADEKDWLLEVEDRHLTSVVWEERFADDQAALQEAVRAIDELGIEGLMAES